MRYAIAYNSTPNSISTLALRTELSPQIGQKEPFFKLLSTFDSQQWIYIQYIFDSTRTMPVALSLKEKAQEKDVGNSPRPLIIQKNLRADFATRRNGGEEGIRTPEALRPAAFRVPDLQPLGHLS